MSAQPELFHVQLSKLRLSPRNARKMSGKGIESLAASILAHGLLQNLVVTPGANDADPFEVVAGGRRLAAMQQLERTGSLDPTFLVPCRLMTDDGVVLEASTAENIEREAMHPADQFVAFKGMVDGGTAIEDVAAHFGVPLVIVQQRLKLANVLPQLMQVYRDGGMKLEQLQALALTDDHTEQKKAWFGVKYDHMRSAREIRDRITKAEVGPDNPLVKFVGADAYEAAGGPVRRDLFNESVYFGDKSLLEKLAVAQLEGVAEQARKEGWSWVDVHLGLDYSAQATYPESGIEPKHEKPSTADKERVAAIATRLKEIDKEGENLEYMDDRYDELQDEQSALWDEKRRLEAGKEVWSDAAKAKTGVLIWLDRQHGLRVARGRLKPGQKSSGGAGVILGKAKPGTKDKPKTATLSQDMVQRLEMHRAAATREHIAADPGGALQLLLTYLVTRLLTNSSTESVLSISPTNAHLTARGLIESKFADVGKSPARKALDDRVAQWKKEGLPTKASEVHGWIGTLTEAKRLQLLALTTALMSNTNSGASGHALAEQFKVDMAKWWTPTPETFYGVVPKALLAAAVVDVSGKADGEAVLLLKKDGAMAETAKKLQGTGWLPKPLRGAHYKAGKPGKAPGKTSPVKKPAPPKPKKTAKPAKKAAKALKKATKK